MKRMIAILLALLVCCLYGPALGESDGSATLVFSSFAGGGYEYAVEIEDPSIVSCAVQYEYEEQDEPIDGASCDVIVTFTGIKPGSTRAIVSGRSPILDDTDSAYAITVDDALNVTLAPARTISALSVARMIEGGFNSFQIAMDGDGFVVSVDDGEERPIDTEAIDELMGVIDAYDVAAWDGFKGADYNIVDGEDFRLSIEFTDGTSVSAMGDNAFPDNYDSAMGEMWRILIWNTEEEAE